MAFIKNLTYKDLTFKLPELKKVTDEEIENELERFRASQVETVEVTDENYELQNGDVANIDFCGYVNGEKFEGGEGKFDLTIGSGQFIPGFEEGMIGMKKGETRDVNVTFPTAYTPELAGKDATFKVTVNKISQTKEAVLSDELVKKATKMQSIEEFKTAYATGDKVGAEKELGDVLFSAVNVGRKAGFDAEKTLKESAERFAKRFTLAEEKALKDGRKVTQLTQEEWDSYYVQAKAQLTGESNV